MSFNPITFAGRFLSDESKRKFRIRMGYVDFKDRLENMRDAGFSPNLVFDVGACHGAWSEMCKEVFPTSKIALIEPQPHLRSELEEFCTKFPDCIWENCLVSDEEGEVSFFLQETNSRIYDPEDNVPLEKVVQVPSLTMAKIVEKHSIEFPNLLKLDTQGHELTILESIGEDLSKIEVIIAELSLLRIGNVPIAREIISFLDQHNFELYDLLGQNYRPLDNALWQVDAFFVRRDSKLLASRTWNKRKK